MKPEIQLLLLFALSLSSCGYYREKESTPIPSASLENEIPSYQKVYDQVLSARCVSCHGTSGGVTLTTYSSAKAAAPLIRKVIIEGSMPPARPLTDPERTILMAWLDADAPEQSVTQPPQETPHPSPSTDPAPNPIPSTSPTPELSPSPMPSAAPSPAPQTWFDRLHTRILVPQCVRCHSVAGGNKGKVNLETYESTVNWIKEIRTELEDQSMPPRKPLDTPDRDAVFKWIDAGAPRDSLPQALE